MRKLGERIEVTRNEEEDVGSYWIKLRKQDDAGKWKRKHMIVLSAVALEEATDLSYDMRVSE